MIKIILLSILILNQSLGFALCNRSLLSIFENESIEQIVVATNSGKDTIAGKKCLDNFDDSVGYPTPDTFCECLDKSSNVDYDTSRKLHRKKLGVKVKSTIFDIIDSLKEYNERYSQFELKLSCNFMETLNEHCTPQFLTELFSENNIENLSNELRSEHAELFPAANETSRYRSNKCTGARGVRVSAGVNAKIEEVQDGIDKVCDEFKQKTISTCKNESLSSFDSEYFEIDALLDPSNVDKYNYYCKIFDKGVGETEYSHTLPHLVNEYKSKDEEPSSYCTDICKDSSPYPFKGCDVSLDRAKASMEKLNCKKEQFSNACLSIKELVGVHVYNQAKSRNLSDSDIAYLKEYLDDEEFNEVYTINKMAYSTQKNSLVDEFFKTEAPGPVANSVGSNVASKSKTQSVKDIARNTPSKSVVKRETAKASKLQSLAIKTSTAPIAKHSNLKMSSARHSSVSSSTKQIVDSIRTLRKAGSSLADALASQRKRAKQREQKFADSKKAKHQRYDARTLEPLNKFFGETRDSKKGSFIPTTADPVANSSGSSSVAGGLNSTGFGNTGSSTFEAPTPKATVVDITGRSAANLNLANLKSSGATLPTSITNHPDASEISKLFNGLDYVEDKKRGPASKDDKEIKKIKVSSTSENIDLGSLLINAKDISPEDEFIIYQGDMDKFVKLTPAYRYRNGKRTFVGYRVKNRNRHNADLVASIYAKKFLIL